jgi:hypothetical protein
MPRKYIAMRVAVVTRRPSQLATEQARREQGLGAVWRQSGMMQVSPFAPSSPEILSVERSLQLPVASCRLGISSAGNRRARMSCHTRRDSLSPVNRAH